MFCSLEYQCWLKAKHTFYAMEVSLYILDYLNMRGISLSVTEYCVTEALSVKLMCQSAW